LVLPFVAVALGVVMLLLLLFWLRQDRRDGKG
jgi:hypothetical protein